MISFSITYGGFSNGVARPSCHWMGLETIVNSQELSSGHLADWDRRALAVRLNPSECVPGSRWWIA